MIGTCELCGEPGIYFMVDFESGAFVGVCACRAEHVVEFLRGKSFLELLTRKKRDNTPSQDAAKMQRLPTKE